MTSRIASKRLSRGFLPISLIILLRANSVSAAAAAGDAQQQARDLLSDTPRESTVIPGENHQTPSLDPQVRPRELILGNPIVARSTGQALTVDPTIAETPLASTRGGPSTYADPQEAARRMILGNKTDDIATPAAKRSVPLSKDPLVILKAASTPL
jgi:hypothetical protein